MKYVLTLFIILLLSGSSIIGQNFTNVVVNHITKGSQNTDPGNSIAVFDDNVYLLWQDMDSTFSSFVSKSTDGGLTFNDGVKIANDSPQIFGSLVLDNLGNLYIAYDKIDSTGEMIKGIYFTKSTDEATTFSTSLTISEEGIFPQIATFGSNVYIFYIDIKNDKYAYYFTRSTNGGVSFENPIEISDVNSDRIKFDAPNSITVDDSGNIYCIWNDGRRNAGGTDIFIAKSTDNGTSFYSNIMVNSSTTSAEKLRTGAHVKTFGSNVYTVWRQEDDNDATNRKILFAKSTDGGFTFGSEMQLAINGWDSPTLTVNNAGDIYVAFPYFSGEYEALTCIKSNDQGNSFPTNVFISEDYQHSKNPSICVDENDVLYATWTVANDGNEDEVLFAKGSLGIKSVATSHRYSENFEENDETGWAFLASDCNVFVENGEINFQTETDDVSHILLPIGATKDDFSFKVVAGSNAKGIHGGGFGRMGFNSLIALQMEDSISVMYTENIGSYTEPNFTYLTKYPFPDVVNTMQLDVTRIDNDLVISAYINDVLIYNGRLNNVNASLFSGKMIIDLIRDDEPLEWSCEEVDVKYNPLIESDVTFYDDFSNENSPWFKFGDFETIAQSVNISNNSMNFIYNGSSETAINVIPPVGAVKDFAIELQGSAGSMHNSTLGISRFFDYKNYTTMFFEGDSIYLGYANNSFEPTIIAACDFTGTALTKVKFSIEEIASNLTMRVWINDELLLTGDVNNVNQRLAVGHLAIGFFDGNVIDVNFDYASFDFVNYITNIDDEISTLPTKYNLSQNYPNPFNPSTTIQYSIPVNVKSEMSNVKLIVYDILGREITTLVNETKSAGNYEVKFDASSLSSGVYLYKIQAGNFINTKKMILMR